MPLGHFVKPGLVAYRTPAFETQLSGRPATLLGAAGLVPADAS